VKTVKIKQQNKAHTPGCSYGHFEKKRCCNLTFIRVSVIKPASAVEKGNVSDINGPNKGKLCCTRATQVIRFKLRPSDMQIRIDPQSPKRAFLHAVAQKSVNGGAFTDLSRPKQDDKIPVLAVRPGRIRLHIRDNSDAIELHSTQ
jgi:hypothetical protein